MAQLAAKLEPTPGGLTAEEVVRKALENSPALKKASLEADKAAANRARAKLAFAPRFDFRAQYTRLSDIKLPPFELLGMKYENPFPVILDNYVVQGSVTVPITEWFLTIVPTYKGASLIGDVAEEQRKAQVLQVAHEARIAFYDYAHARGGEEVALASVKVLEASVKDLEGLVEVGASTPTELARTRAALAGAQALATQMQGLVDVTLERLSQLMGEPVSRERGIGEALIGIELADPPPAEQVVGEAKSSRPELKALRALEQARTHFARARRGSVLPQIHGLGNVYYMNPHQRFMPPVEEFKTTWDVGVRLTWSPNDAAYNYTQAQDAEAELRMVQEDLRNFEQHIAVEAASAVTGIRTAASHIDAATEKLDAARRYYSDQRALMLAGAATPNDVLLAERDLTAAALEWVDAFIEARRAQANLLKAQGKTGLAQTSPATSSSSRSTP